jgi:tetratricopeptide (TPR) repeat protein
VGWWQWRIDRSTAPRVDAIGSIYLDPFHPRHPRLSYFVFSSRKNWYKKKMHQIHAASLLRSLSIPAAIIFTSAFAVLGAPDEDAREPVIRIVSRIQRADYEGDRVMLKRRYDELAQFANNKTLAARVRYWRGFAMWRRAINGFNDAVDPKELEQDLQLALNEFDKVTATEPGFGDAKIAMVSCISLLGYIHQKDAERLKELFAQLAPVAKEAKEVAPDNPRLFWVFGPNVFITSPERGGGQEKAIEMYEKGLELSRKNKASEDRLEPSWGEPELLMNLAYSNLNKNTPDVNAAERQARAALEIVPYWHYVRDILLPQILAAKAKAK